MTSTRRAILVSEEQRYAADQWAALLGRNGWTVSESLLDEIVAAYDNAGDQPRIRWCAVHDCGAERCGFGLRRRPEPCRVVDAIVCVLPEQCQEGEATR